MPRAQLIRPGSSPDAEVIFGGDVSGLPSNELPNVPVKPTVGMPTVRWVYAGKRHKAGGGTLSLFYLLGEGGSYNDEEDRRGTTGVKANAVGSIYTVKATGTSFIPGSIKWTSEKYPNQNQIDQWEIESRMVEAVDKMTRLEKKARANALHCLDPLRAMYRKCFAADRVAMELVILNYLRGGGLEK
jgi:hypothetical protein